MTSATNSNTVNFSQNQHQIKVPCFHQTCNDNRISNILSLPAPDLTLAVADLKGNDHAIFKQNTHTHMVTLLFQNNT